MHNSNESCKACMLCRSGTLYVFCLILSKYLYILIIFAVFVKELLRCGADIMIMDTLTGAQNFQAN